MPRRYVHDERAHNDRAASVIVPQLMSLFSPKSVLDVGCGIGTFLGTFRGLGIADVIGVDGDWVNRELLRKHMPLERFMAQDLERPLDLRRRFDLAICLEVAEHLRESSSETLITSLTTASDVVVFSAAIPGQGGQNHVNEQPLSYWIERFRKRGFRFCDCLRPRFWGNRQIDVWYRQNMVVFVKEGSHPHISSSSDAMADLVHPEYWEQRCALTQELLEARAPIRTYVGLLLRRLRRA
jgi:SAM-dependent methyltransferase